MDYRNELLSSGISHATAEFPYHKNSDQVFQYKLLLKTHYETGIHYLCITKLSNYKKYSGSGSRWKKLLAKIPSDIYTTLLYSTDDKEDLAVAAAYHSVLFDLPKNPLFANLVPELGYEENQGNLAEWVKNADPEILTEIRSRQAVSMKKTISEMKVRGEDFGFEIMSKKLYEETGLTSYMQIPEVAARCRASQIESLQEIYGVSHNMQIPGVAAKVHESAKKNHLAKYNVEYVMQRPEIMIPARAKAIETLMRERGVVNISQTPGWKERVGPKISKAKRNSPKQECRFCGLLTKALKIHERFCENNPNKEERIIYNCCVCNLESKSIGNITRWHNDNCKMKGQV